MPEGSRRSEPVRPCGRARKDTGAQSRQRERGHDRKLSVLSAPLFSRHEEWRGGGQHCVFLSRLSSVSLCLCGEQLCRKDLGDRNRFDLAAGLAKIQGHRVDRGNADMIANSLCSLPPSSPDMKNGEAAASIAFSFPGFPLCLCASVVNNYSGRISEIGTGSTLRPGSQRYRGTE